jgi:hypothetical protein
MLMPRSAKSTPDGESPGAKLRDPRERFAKPPLPKQQQPPPGSSRELKPLADSHVKTLGQNTTLKRPAMPVEQAAIFVFLAFDGASYVNGEVYGATGGRIPI